MPATLSLALSVLPLAAASAGSAPLAADKDVRLWENRFFFKQYAHDPIEKRLQRLELLVFGATQGGSTDQRAARLKKTIADRDKQAGDAAKDQPQAAESKKTSGSLQYPILNTFEWRVFKKTYPTGTLDERLERLETKLFGQSSPAMAYADRVERLKRMLGMDVAQGGPEPSGPLGPKPKARPRGEMPGEEPWMWGSPLTPDSMPPGTFRLPPMVGANPQMTQMLKEFERQMDEMMRMNPGQGSRQFRWDPENGWRESAPGNRGKPSPGPVLPSPFDRDSHEPTLPPYYDPNSI